MTPAAIVRAGLRDQNPGLVQLLGLCPLLAVSTSLGRGLALGLATLAVLTVSNTLTSLVARHVPGEVRIPVFVVLIASLVTALELAITAWRPGLHAALGIFLPLIVSNCLLLARAETFASRQPVVHAMVDGLAMGTGFTLVIVLLGAVREVLGHGSLGSDLDQLFGPAAHSWGVHLFAESHGLLLAVLPPGAFILLGLLLAWRQSLRSQGAAATQTLVPGPSTLATDHIAS